MFVLQGAIVGVDEAGGRRSKGIERLKRKWGKNVARVSISPSNASLIHVHGYAEFPA
jgi:hypothetical protein